jgi:peroxiredoxin
MRFLALIAAFVMTLSAPAFAEQEGFAPNVVLVTDGKTVPDKPLMYVDGSQGSLADFVGDVLIVTMWQVNCPYCHKEMPVLNRLHGEMQGEGIKVVALGMDQSIGTITAHLAQTGLSNLKPIMDIGKFNGTIFSVENFGRMSIATPTSVIVNKQGTVVARVWGLVDWDGDAARSYLRELAAS